MGQIESDFGAKYLAVVVANIDGKAVPYWTFAMEDTGLAFPAFAFAVPVNANDTLVANGIISARASAHFTDMMMKMSKPSPSPTLTF